MDLWATLGVSREAGIGVVVVGLVRRWSSPADCSDARARSERVGVELSERG